MTNIIQALHDPSSVYKHPFQVLEDKTLTRAEKIKILRQWEYDAREFEVADQENMPSVEMKNPGYLLQQIALALHKLEVKMAA